MTEETSPPAPARREDPIACSPAPDPATNTQAARTARRAGFRTMLGGDRRAYTPAPVDDRPPAWSRARLQASLPDIAPQFGKTAAQRRST